MSNYSHAPETVFKGTVSCRKWGIILENILKIHCDLSFQPILMILVPKYSSWWVVPRKIIKKVKKKIVKKGQKRSKTDFWGFFYHFWPFWPFCTILYPFYFFLFFLHFEVLIMTTILVPRSSNSVENWGRNEFLFFHLPRIKLPCTKSPKPWLLLN